MRTLLIEPDAHTRRMVEEALHRQGHTVDAFADVERGWAAAEAEPFPLVLLSWKLPDMGSADLCRRMVEAAAPFTPFIIALTTSDSPEAVSAALAAGAHDCWTKPLHEAFLAARISVATRDAEAMHQLAQAYEASHRTGERYRSLVQNASDLMTIVDAHGVVCHETPAGKHVLGYPEGSLKGINALTLVHPDDVPRVTQLFREGLDHPNHKLRTLLRFRHQDGSWRWLETIGVNLLGDPNVRGIVVTAQDVTGRQEQEERLRISEQRHRELLAEAERQAQELRLLGAVREAIAKELELPIVIRTMVEAIAQTFGYALVSFYTVEGDDLVLQHQMGYPRVIDRIPADRGVAGRVARTGTPVLLEDAHDDPDFLAAFDGILSEICVPVHDQGRVTGILNVETVEPARLGQADLHLMVALSEHLSIAVSRARLFAEVRAGDERFRSAFGDAATGMALVDVDGQLMQVNRAFDELVGSTTEERPLALSDVTDPDDRELLARRISLVAGQSVPNDQVELRFVRTCGDRLWVSLNISLVRDQRTQSGYLLIQAQDVSARRELMQRLEYQALHDPLTGLPNRNLLADKLECALARKDRRQSGAAVLILDLDGFKLINDSLGHGAGDHLLMATAQRLAEAVRPTDTIARLEGTNSRSFSTGLAIPLTRNAPPDSCFTSSNDPSALMGMKPISAPASVSPSVPLAVTSRATSSAMRTSHCTAPRRLVAGPSSSSSRSCPRRFSRDWNGKPSCDERSARGSFNSTTSRKSICDPAG